MQLLIVVVVALVAATSALLLLLVIRRVWLGRRERRHAETEARMRPVAVAFVVGEEPLPPDLSAYEQTVLAEQLRRYSHSLTGEATERIASYFRDSAAYREAIAGMRSRRAFRRADFAFALGDMGVGEATPVLLEALSDRSRIVRTSAARGLGRLQAEEAAVPLVEALAEQSVPRGVAGNALLRIGPKIVPQLRELVETQNPDLQATALTVIGLVGDSRDSATAVRGLHDPSAEVRVAAAEALGRIGMPSSEGELQDALDDRVGIVRAKAAESLGAIGTRSALPRLLELARSDDFEAARAAAQAATKIDPRAVEAAADEPGAGAHLHEAVDRAAL